MTRTTQFLRLSLVVTVAVAVGQASAWGPRSQRAITGMAIQVIQSKYPGTFRPGDSNYERDVLLGAEAGWSVIARDLPISSNDEAIQAIGAQINLLSQVRSFGAGSYFAYRLGSLSSLISDLMLPYGLVWNPEDEEMKKLIQKDIEEHLNHYGYTDFATKRTIITNVVDYFRAQQHFYQDNKIIIADDYKRGKGYDGLLKQSSKAQFEGAIDAVSDVWYTILESGESKPAAGLTNGLVAQYFVDEIAYQLDEKRNFHQAGMVYENLASLNVSSPKVYESVGDLYYGFGTRESAERSVREWRIAYDLGGPGRAEVAQKISDHFLREGRDYLEQADEKGKGETELPAALSAFRQALQYNRTSQVAADLIQDTNKRIAVRNEKREMIIDIIASAEKAREEADNLATGGNYGNAIPSYRQAIEILSAVDDEFTDQADIAERSTSDIKKSISTAITNVRELASAAIEEGERLEEQHKYDDAKMSYGRVPVLVKAIPDDHNKTTTQDKNELIALAEKKIKEADVSKARYEASQQNQPAAGAPARPAVGGLSAPAPAAAGAARRNRLGDN